MKILHTADWHLGKKLDRFSRFEEQKEVMEELIHLADLHQVDAVLIAGDLFDNFNPAVEAVELFYKTLVKLSKNGKRPVIAIAGNHDSPAFIDTPNALAKANGIILIGFPKARISRFELEEFSVSDSDEGFLEIKFKKFDYPLRIMHTAYANETRLKKYFGEEKEKALNEVLAEHWLEMAEKYCDEKGVNILMTHLYMNKKGSSLLEEPEGEKPLKIGNADLVFSHAIPPQIQYTALGHLHSFQNIGSIEKPVVYSSSSLCYSFSESGQKKCAVIIEAEPNKKVEFQKIEFENGRSLVRKTFDSVDLAIDWLNENQNCLIELTLVSDDYLKAEDRKRLYQAHDGIIFLIPKVKNISNPLKHNQEVNLEQDIRELFKDYFKSKNANQEPNEELMDLFNEILN